MAMTTREQTGPTAEEIAYWAAHKRLLEAAKKKVSALPQPSRHVAGDAA